MSQSAEFAESLKELSPQKPWADFRSLARTGGRRTQHGSTAWTSTTDLMQPQDGASTTSDAGRVANIGLRAKISGLTSAISGMSSAALREPEDANLTGSTRSLVRRMMGLNIAGREARKVALVETKNVA